jgi:hypothetical protein
MVFTAGLQNEGLSKAPSVAVNELDVPALNGSFSRRGSDEPACGGGVYFGGTSWRAEKDSHAAALFRGKLEPPGLDPRKRRDGRDDCADAFAPQALGDRPNLVGGLGMQEIQPLQRNAVPGQRGRENFMTGVRPDDGPAARRACQKHGNKKRFTFGVMREQFVDGPAGERPARSGGIESGQAGAERPPRRRVQPGRFERQQLAIVTRDQLHWASLVSTLLGITGEIKASQLSVARIHLVPVKLP